MATIFETLRAVRKLQDVGAAALQSRAHVKGIDEATDELATKEDLQAALRSAERRMRAEFNRALMIHTGIVITAMAVVAAIAVLIVEVL